MREERESLPTINDVAAAAGVSISTVSKALNDTGQLKESTRRHVKAIAEQLGFRPSPAARSLTSGRTYTVGVLTSDRIGRFTMPLIQGIEDSLSAGQVSTLLCDGRGDPLRERYLLADLVSRRIDGLVVTGRRTDVRASLGRLPIPVVYVLMPSDDPADLSVTYDEVHAAETAVGHLVDGGRTRIAYVGGTAAHKSTQSRREGCDLALATVGAQLQAENVLLGDWSEDWGRSAAALLARRPADRRVDGVFCASDQIARGLVDGFRESGLSVPDDVSVVGFDNWDVMALASRPQLTTMDPHLVDIGRYAADRLMQALNGNDLGHGLVQLPCELVMRGSSIPK